jgi:hypothetical protein
LGSSEHGRASPPEPSAAFADLESCVNANRRNDGWRSIASTEGRPRRRGARLLEVRPAIIDDSGSATACFDQIVKIGFGRRGDWRDTDGPTSKGTCIDRTVLPAGGARAHKDGFLVPCGALSLIGVDSMKNVGQGMVSVTYRRTFDRKPVADQMGYCRDGELFMPDRGTRTKSLTLSRQSDGRWGIEHLEPFSAVHVL